MGQRLNIEILDGGIPLANSYYHWSAYSGDSLKLTRQIISLLSDKAYVAKYPDKRELAIRLLEATGAGANDSEYREIAKNPKLSKYTIKECTDRNNGLIAISEAGMEETRNWEEGRVSIDLHSGTFNFGVYDESSREEYYEWNSKEEYNELPIIDKSLEGDFPFNEIGALCELYEKTRDHYAYRLPNGNVIHWIE